MSQPYELIDFTSGSAVSKSPRSKASTIRAKRASDSDLKYDEATAAKKLGVCQRTLRRWRQAGKLPYIRAGLFIWYTDDLLNVFLKQSAQNIRTQ